MTDSNHSAFFNREISWLEFNWRVLNEAKDERTPLLERLNFLSIVASNLDEFVMKRVGGLKRQVGARVRQRSIDGRTPQQALRDIREVILRMAASKRKCLLNELLPKLAEKGIRVLDYADLNDGERREMREFFQRSLFPVLTPLAVDPGHPFPFLSNLTLSLAVRLVKPGNGGVHFARVKIPTNVPRWISLKRTHHFVPLEQIIANNLDGLFPGTEILEVQPFRITRSADVARNEEEAEDLLELVEEELRHRRFAPAVRLEVAEQMSAPLRRWLRQSLEVDTEDIYAVAGPLNLVDLRQLTKVDLPTEIYPPFRGVTHPRLRELDESDIDTDIFSIIREGDLLVHHPYQSFSTSVLRFLQSAAVDAKVLAIKQTLYRTAENSPIIAALVKAANNGKQVAVLVEIKARFDEAKNIEWVKVLEDAGVHVTYGLVGLKTHTKTLLVIREDPDGLRSYFHIGTGNYHTGTARLYTDVGLISCNPEIGSDLVHLFNYLTGHSNFHNYRKILVAPVNMRARFLEMVGREIQKSTPEVPGRIIAKMNQLEDRDIIEELYRASQAGVQIDLLIRGFNCLRPGVPGLSDNIRITSAIGRFLEHSRIFYFRNGGDEEYYIGSADWMNRNLDRRVEAATPIEDPRLKIQLRDILDAHLRDQRQTWDLHPDGKYIQRTPKSKEQEAGVQAMLMKVQTSET